MTRAGGVLAIDSKWRNEVTADMLNSDAAAARAAARRAESILRSEHVEGAQARGSRPTRGRWRIVFRHAGRGDLGAVRHKMPDSAMREDVEFVPGEKLAAWLRTRNGQPVDRAVANDLLERLAAFRTR